MFTKIRSIYRRKKNREYRRKSNFWKILRFLSNFVRYSLFFTPIYSAEFCETFFMVHPHHMNKHMEFHTYRLKPTRNNIRASQTKTGKSSKNLTFSDFHDFFTPIYSANFCETFFMVHLHHMNEHKEFHTYRCLLAARAHGVMS